VANLALGGIMTIHGDTGPFQHALQGSLARAKIAGFSPEALAQERMRKPV
jgi:hypothetical protein